MNPSIAKMAEPARAQRQPVPRPDRAALVAARVRLVEERKTIAAWADENGESPAQVSKVLSGTRACTSGEALRIAVKLGIRPASVPAIQDA